MHPDSLMKINHFVVIVVLQFQLHKLCTVMAHKKLRFASAGSYDEKPSDDYQTQEPMALHHSGCFQEPCFDKNRTGLKLKSAGGGNC
jgi:hypothetical protein